MKRFNIAILLFSVVLFTKGYGQDMYRTQNGNMVITAVSNDSVILLKTKELLVLLNYENASFEIKMDKSTFYTGIDSLDRKLKLLKFDIVKFKGKLDVPYISTERHPPLDFNVEGVISTNSNIIKGTGSLRHISTKGKISCILTMKFTIKKDELGLDLEGLNVKDDIQIEIVQVVLNKLVNE